MNTRTCVLPVLTLTLMSSALMSSAAFADIRITGMTEAAFSQAVSGGENTNGFGGGIGALMTFGDPGLNLQLSGGGAYANGGGITANSWTGDADAFWRDHKGAFGVSIAHGSINAYGLSADVTGYGVFGEWYANRWMTLRFNGGGFSGDTNGWYGSAGAEAYLYKTSAVFIEYDYIKPSSIYLSRMNDASVGAEYLFSDTLPLSLRFSFDHTWTAGSDANGLSIALRYRFGQSGTLVSLDRSGPTSWNGLPSLLRAW